MNVFDLEASISLDKSGYEAGLNEAKSAGDAAGRSIASNFSGKLATAASVASTAAAAAVAVGKAVYSAGKAFYNAAADVAAYGDSIDKASQRLGVSSTFYQEWEAVMGHSGTSMANMTGAFKVLANAATGATDAQAAAFDRLGMSLDAVKSMSQEDLFRETVQRLGEMESGTERAALAQDLLGRSAMELGPLLNAIGADPGALDDMISRFDQLGLLTEEDIAASARFQDSLQDMQTAVGGVSKAVTADFLPGLADIMDGITEIFAGGSGADAIKHGIDSMIDAAKQDIPVLMDVGLQIVTNIAAGVADAIPQLVARIPEVVEAAYNAAVNLAPNMEAAGYALVEAIANGAPGAFAGVCSVINNLGAAIFALLAGFVSGMAAKGAELVAGVGRGISGGVGSVVSAARGVVQGAVGAITGAVSQFVTIGSQIVQGLARGVASGASAVVSAIKSTVQNAISAAKGALGIASPSKVFRQIGAWTIEGFTAGILSRAKEAARAAVDVAAIVTNGFTEQLTEYQRRIDAIQAEQQRRADEAELRERETRLSDLYAKLAAATGADIEKYQAEIDKLKADYAEKDLQRQEAAQIKELQSAQDHLEDMQRAYQDAMDDIADTYTETTRDIGRKQDSLFGKLMDYGDLFDIETRRNGTQKFTLNNLDSDITTLERYSEILNGLTEKGVPASLMSEIMGLSIDDAIAYGGKLLNMGGSMFNGYISKWNEREALASSISANYYAGDMSNAAAVRAAAEERVNTEYAGNIGVDIGASVAAAVGAQVQELVRALSTESVVLQIDGAEIGRALLNPISNAMRQRGVVSLA